MDAWTAESLNNLVRYWRDDRKIAAYLGCSLKDVAAARARLPKSHQLGRPITCSKAQEPRPTQDKFAADAREGTRKLAEAIERVQTANSKLR
jgi:hypothetical protein